MNIIKLFVDVACLIDCFLFCGQVKQRININLATYDLLVVFCSEELGRMFVEHQLADTVSVI